MNLESPDIAKILKTAKRIAVVGLSDDPSRDSHSVSAYMQAHGYKIIPVNPKGGEILGEKVYPDLKSVPGHIDIVNIFRKPEAVPAIVDEAIQIKAGAIWMQLGIVHEQAAEKARKAGIPVIMDQCILIEHRALSF